MHGRAFVSARRSLQQLMLSLCLVLVSLAGCDFGARERARAEAARAVAEQAAARAASLEAQVRAEAAAAKARAAEDAAKPSAESSEEQAAETKTAASPPAGLTADEAAAGWLSLFDGSTLFGWEPTSQADWQVKDGLIEVSSGEPGLLCTTTQFADYELRLDFRFAKGTNSGVFLHSPRKPTAPEADCYELNIAEPDVSPFPTGSYVKRQKAECTAEPDTWHTFEVKLVGPKSIVKLDGETVLEYDDPKPLARGFIGLQLNKGAVAFRNIRLRPLSLRSIFNGVDLGGWKQPAKSDSTFTVGPESALHVAGGKGYLESVEQYGDFALQFDCRTNAPNLNSGMFFRCIPDQEMMGYECQIHNGFRDGDRSKPADCGTGGIFRRKDARRVVADDKTWFRVTVIADGPHVSTWVNGYQTTDWTDTRKPDENPRKGLRTAAGTLQIQGHDPTTDIDFRTLMAVELVPRASE